jgi:hypothetical protein
LLVASCQQDLMTNSGHMPVRKRLMNTIVMKKAAMGAERSLCLACYWAHVQKGFRESEEAVYCCFSKFRPVPFKVADCTDFNNKTVPTREQMEDMALIISTQPARKPSGFAGVGFAAGEEVECEVAVECSE